MGCRLTDRWWKVLLAAVLAMGLTATGFFRRLRYGLFAEFHGLLD